MTTTLARNWWALALRGLLAVLFGLGALIWPGITLFVLVLLFGAYALVDGIFSLVAAVRGGQSNERWWMLVLEGIAGIGAGLITFFWPGISALALLYLIAAWAVITGILEIAAAIRLRKEIEGEWLLALGGVASVIFGVLLFIWPGSGALAVTWMIGIYALIFGVMLITLGFRLRSWYNSTDRQVAGTA